MIGTTDQKKTKKENCFAEDEGSISATDLLAGFDDLDDIITD
jgi:hypothetical protein